VCNSPDQKWLFQLVGNHNVGEPEVFFKDGRKVHFSNEQISGRPAF
jgi:hypothetical protein